MKHPHLLDVLNIRSTLKRLCHIKSRKHVAGMVLGTVVCCLGSYLSMNVPESIPHWLWDAGAYSIHGLGLIPICKHAEPFWLIIMGD